MATSDVNTAMDILSQDISELYIRFVKMFIKLFKTNFIITQLEMFDLFLRFDHHRRPSSGTEWSVVTFAR